MRGEGAGAGRGTEGFLHFDCRALLLDLDGVLVESHRAIERSWRVWAERNGLDGEEVLRLCPGRPSLETIALVAPHLDAATEARRLEEEQAADTLDLVVCPGAERLLGSLPRPQWAIVTSGTRTLAEARLVAAGLPLPPVLVTADDVERGKPLPLGYLQAAERLQAKPRHCVVIEDSRPGLVAARRAGTRVVGIQGPALGPPEDADAVVESLLQLTPVLADDLLVGLNVAGAG